MGNGITAWKGNKLPPETKNCGSICCCSSFDLSESNSTNLNNHLTYITQLLICFATKTGQVRSQKHSPLGSSETATDNLGCWQDKINRAIQPIEGKHFLLNDSYKSRVDAYGKCREAALSLGYKVFALQKGGWCASASNAEDTYDKYGQSSDCQADGKGGPWANQVYKIHVQPQGKLFNRSNYRP